VSRFEKISRRNRRKAFILAPILHCVLGLVSPLGFVRPVSTILQSSSMGKKRAACTPAEQSPIDSIMQKLDELYPPPVPVPLNHGNAFQMLVAVVLSAQTTDGAVNKCTTPLFEVVKNPAEMVKLGQGKILDAISSLGLANNKAKFLYNLSMKLCETPEYLSGDVIPRLRSELTDLPGVGDKTASVVLSQVFGEPNLAVDTHVHRLANRWGLSAEKTNVMRVKADLEAAFPREVWNKVHLQMIYYGREFCTAKSHDAKTCPICSHLLYGVQLDPKQATTASPSKGIVFYSDRKSELSVMPALTLGNGVTNSPLPKSKKTKKT